MTGEPESLLQDVVSWGRAQPDVHAIGLAGSHARGSAGAGSDIDVVLLVDDVERWFSDRRWTASFGVVSSAEREHWGPLESLRVRYDHGILDPDRILAAAVTAAR